MLVKQFTQVRLFLAIGILLLLLVIPHQPPVYANDCTTTASSTCTG